MPNPAAGNHGDEQASSMVAPARLDGPAQVIPRSIPDENKRAAGSAAQANIRESMAWNEIAGIIGRPSARQKLVREK
ncbi:hypothetical protein HK405_001089, partial [Cladochytrium tenue]